MSNYPAGVTGNEWQIVGLDERPGPAWDEFECPNEECQTVTVEAETVEFATDGMITTVVTCPACGRQEDVQELTVEEYYFEG